MKRSFAAGCLAVQILIASSAAAQSPTGIWEGEIADPRRPQVITIDFDQAVASIGGGAAIPISPPVVGPENAIDFEMRGGATVRFSGRRRGSTVSGTMKGPARELAFTITELPAVRANVSRTVKWQEDVDAVALRFLRYDRSFSPAARASAVRRLTALRNAVPRRTDQEILVELARIVALGNNGHTRLYFIRNRTEVSRLPVRGWWFGREFRIVRATAEHRDLLGCRVLRIGRSDVDAAFRRLQDLKAGNTSWQRYMSAYYLTSPDVLAGAGVTNASDKSDVRGGMRDGAAPPDHRRTSPAAFHGRSRIMVGLGTRPSDRRCLAPFRTGAQCRPLVSATPRRELLVRLSQRSEKLSTSSTTVLKRCPACLFQRSENAWPRSSRIARRARASSISGSTPAGIWISERRSWSVCRLSADRCACSF
jgi:hypothetical protein